MSRWLPYPLLTVSLLAMWVLLNGLSPGQVLLGALIAMGASRTMTALEPARPRIRNPGTIARLLWRFFVDIIRSNIAVAGMIVRGRREGSRPGFVTIPLAIRDRTGLAVLACVLTATPGTAWVEYRSRRNTLLLHVLDLTDEKEWIDLVKQRYEPLLLEIFE